MTAEFERELKESLYIHRMLPLHMEKSLEEEERKKKVLSARPLFYDYWKGKIQKGIYGIQTVWTEKDDIFIKMEANTVNSRWPEGAALDGDYSNFGNAETRIQLDGENWEGYHRLRFRVKPEVVGAEVVHLNASLQNDGKIKIPDIYARDGFTIWNLKNHQWNECIWEFPELPRDKVTRLSFYVFLNGNDTAMTGNLIYTYCGFQLEQVEDPEKEHGWKCAKDTISVSGAGYMQEGRKTAVANIEEEAFSVVEEDSGNIVYTGRVRKCEAKQGIFEVLDFTSLETPGKYYIKAGKIKSQCFTIGQDLIEENAWRCINFLYGERCGTVVPGKHGMCHQDITAEHQGKKMNYAGGWHDAGDVSQQTAQSGEIVAALLEMAESFKEIRPLLYARLLEEAKWGLDFILRTRFGDGYRATSAGATRWTKGLLGDMDDVKARVYNHAYENFLFSGIEAYGFLKLQDEDFPLAEGSLNAAEEDFKFAMDRFLEKGAEAEQMYEHTYNSGMSLYYAVIVWSASLLYQSTGKEIYGNTAEEMCEKLLKCQETGGAGLPFTGFFYRDETHKRIVHFNHQAREHQYIQALAALCEARKDSAERPVWETAMRRYGEYLKGIWNYASPYGMMPSGVYRKDEYLDAEVFPYLHVLCSYETEKENYRMQLENGMEIGEEHVIRSFPVWFSFRGNTVVLLSQGKAASILGRYFNDEELLQMGREQLYWVGGKNPFRQSLMYGAGSRYPSQYAIFPGECVGEMPVGIETRGNDDQPFWPRANNATYKEVWTSSAGRWLLLAADFVHHSGFSGGEEEK